MRTSLHHRHRVVILGVALVLASWLPARALERYTDRVLVLDPITLDLGTPVATPTVTVFDAGTLDFATLFSDNLATPTPLANPFLGTAEGLVQFYAAAGRYDVQYSLGTPAITTPYTLGDQLLQRGLSANLFNVRDAPCSAVGDGVADDTTALVTCYAAADAASGTMYIPQGTYRITAQLTWDGSANVRGDGTTASEILKDGNFVGILIGQPLDTGIVIEGFYLRGNGGIDVSDGIQIDSLSGQFILRNVRSDLHGGHGFLVLEGSNDHYEFIRAALNGGDGFRMAPTGIKFVNANTGIRFDLNSNTGDGMNLFGGGAGNTANQFIGVVSQGNTGYGLSIDDLTNKIELYSENNTAGDLLYDTSSIRNFVTILNKSAALAVTDNGVNNWTFNFAEARWHITSLSGSIPGTNVTGRSTSYAGGTAGAGALGRQGGVVSIIGGTAAGSAGAAAGGRASISGGTGINGGAIGTVSIQEAGGSVVVGGTVATNTSVGLELQGTTMAFLLSRMTTVQKNALTAVDGMMVYDTDLAKGQIREGGAWVSFP